VTQDQCLICRKRSDGRVNQDVVVVTVVVRCAAYAVDFVKNLNEVSEINELSLVRCQVYLNSRIYEINKSVSILTVTAEVTRHKRSGATRHRTLFTGLVMSKIIYALPAFAGQLTSDDRNRIGAISRKALRRGVIYCF